MIRDSAITIQVKNITIQMKNWLTKGDSPIYSDMSITPHQPNHNPYLLGRVHKPANFKFLINLVFFVAFTLIRFIIGYPAASDNYSPGFVSERDPNSLKCRVYHRTKIIIFNSEYERTCPQPRYNTGQMCQLLLFHFSNKTPFSGLSVQNWSISYLLCMESENWVYLRSGGTKLSHFICIITRPLHTLFKKNTMYF